MRPRPRADSALVKALARAHRWERVRESGECASITELAAAEKIDRSYVCRVLRLTLLAPEIVEAIMDGRQAEDVTLPALMKGFPVEWQGQGKARRGRNEARRRVLPHEALATGSGLPTSSMSFP